MRILVICLLLPAVLQSALIAQLVALAGCQTHRDAAGMPHLHARSHSRHSHAHGHGHSHRHGRGDAHRHSHGHVAVGQRAGSGVQPACNCLQAPAEPEDAVYLTELTLQTRRPCELAAGLAGHEWLCGCSAADCAAAVCKQSPVKTGPGIRGPTIFLLGCSLRL